MRQIARILLAVICLATGGMGSAAAIQPADGSAAAVTHLPTGAYRLGPGDKLKITTFGEQALSGEFVIDGSGSVAMPLVGTISAGGKTAREVEAMLVTALRDGYLKDPAVTVEVLTYRPFYILGEVNRPGTYPYSDGLTVHNAVATAQGFTYRANTKRVYIKRDGQTEERTYPLNSNTLVAPGDTIRVGERFF